MRAPKWRATSWTAGVGRYVLTISLRPDLPDALSPDYGWEVWRDGKCVSFGYVNRRAKAVAECLRCVEAQKP